MNHSANILIFLTLSWTITAGKQLLDVDCGCLFVFRIMESTVNTPNRIVYQYICLHGCLYLQTFKSYRRILFSDKLHQIACQGIYNNKR